MLSPTRAAYISPPCWLTAIPMLGKHTGRKALEHIARTFGCELDDSQMDRVLHDVKERSEGKCAITSEVLKELIRNARGTK